jgi:hypothetical protein
MDATIKNEAHSTADSELSTRNHTYLGTRCCPDCRMGSVAKCSSATYTKDDHGNIVIHIWSRQMKELHGKVWKLPRFRILDMHWKSNEKNSYNKKIKLEKENRWELYSFSWSPPWLVEREPAADWPVGAAEQREQGSTNQC